MSEPFLGEIRAFSFGFVPRGWARCDGSLLSIASNQALFSIIGTMFGGNGTTTFALPNLQGRVPVHPGDEILYGAQGGESQHVLTISEIPPHTHRARSSNQPASSQTAENHVWARAAVPIYNGSADVMMSSQALSPSGGGHAHNNMQPYLVTNYCIATAGIYPPRD